MFSWRRKYALQTVYKLWATFSHLRQYMTFTTSINDRQQWEWFIGSSFLFDIMLKLVYRYNDIGLFSQEHVKSVFMVLYMCMYKRHRVYTLILFKYDNTIIYY